MALTKEQSLREAIAHEETQLAKLADKYNKTQERLASLKTELATMEPTLIVPSSPEIQTSGDIPTTAEGKISLFRQLFRGRDDVFPLLWISSKTGRKGYSPACNNEWVHGVCEKPGVKCSECPNQAFLPVSDQVVLDHLQGRHTIGVYPLLRDETCWFLAADFDKESWLDDVAAFVDTCRDIGVPAASDQWAYLASLTRMASSTVESIAREATRKGKIVGVRFSSVNEDGRNDAPWELSPSGRPEKVHITEPVPAEVHAVLAQRLCIDKTDLPSPLLNQIKRLAAFQNPEFYKKQSMRLSTALTPRVISCTEEFPKHIALPRGCQDELAALLQHYGSALTIDDQRHTGDPLDVHFDRKLTAIQKQVVNILRKHDIGVIVAPPGVGKTIVGT